MLLPAVILALVLITAPRHDAAARMIAGWDFSQYIGAGLLSVDGVNPADTLSANYSNLLPETTTPPYALGPNAAPFGTLYYNGAFGSSDFEITGTGTEPFSPAPGTLISNLDAPILSGDSLYSFNDGIALQQSGQSYFNPLTGVVQINGPLRLVFRADLSTVPETGTDWSISFAGQTLRGVTAVSIEFSTDGTNYSSAGVRTIDTLDQRFFVRLSDGPSEQAFVRMNFDPTEDQFPAIDNVAININLPEPAGALGAVAAFTALALRARCRGVMA
jgi:hypothetical protein